MEDGNQFILQIRYEEGRIASPLTVIPAGYYEIDMIQQGKYDVILNGKERHLNAGDIVCFKPGDLMERMASEEKMRYAALSFCSKEKVELDSVLVGGITETVAKELELLDSTLKTFTDHKQEKAEALFRCLLLELKDISSQGMENMYIKQMKQYIHDNISQKITLEQLSELTSLHPVYCCQLFKRSLGTTLVEYINRERVENSKVMLMDRSLTVEYIAQACGFSDSNYFARVFRKYEGASPVEYRKNFLSLSQGNPIVF